MGERFRRLIVPFLVGSLLLTSLQAYFNWLFRLRVGMYHGSYLQFLLVERFQGWNPTIFGWMGYHLWFLAYLFVVSLLLMPLLQWLRAGTGRRAVYGWQRCASAEEASCSTPCRSSWFNRAATRPSPKSATGPTFSTTCSISWAAISSTPTSAYHRHPAGPLAGAERRDRRSPGPVATVALGEAETLFSDPSNPGFRPFWACAAVDAWCWSVFMLYVGMRFLDFSNAWTHYGQEAIVPFYVLHQPVIYILAFFVVQWQTERHGENAGRHW